MGIKFYIFAEKRSDPKIETHRFIPKTKKAPATITSESLPDPTAVLEVGEWQAGFEGEANSHVTVYDDPVLLTGKTEIPVWKFNHKTTPGGMINGVLTAPTATCDVIHRVPRGAVKGGCFTCPNMALRAAAEMNAGRSGYRLPGDTTPIPDRGHTGPEGEPVQLGIEI